MFFYGFEYVFFMGLDMFFWVLIWFGIDLGPGLGQWQGPGGMEGAYPNHIVNHIFLKIKKTHIQIAKKTKMVRGFKKSDA